MCQSFSEMHIAITTTPTKRNCFKTTYTEQFHLNCVQRNHCGTLVEVINKVCIVQYVMDLRCIHVLYIISPISPPLIGLSLH